MATKPETISSEKKRWSKLPSWLHTNYFFKKDLEKGGPMEEVNPEFANLVSSLAFKDELTDWHYPLLDLDMDAKLIPSTTSGHHHLMINKLLSKEQYDKLLKTLYEVGIIQKGIIELQWEQDGMTCLRLPGDVKTKNSMSSGGPIEPTPMTYGLFDPSLTSNAALTSTGPLTSISVPTTVAATLTSNHIEAKHVKSDKGTPELIDVFHELAIVAQKTGHSLYETVSAWKEFADNSPKEEIQANPF